MANFYLRIPSTQQPEVDAATAVQSAEMGDADSNVTHARCSVQDKVEYNQEKCTPTHVVAVQQRSVPKRSMLEELLPMPFAIPKNFPPLVAAGLQARSLTGKAAVKFISEIAHAVFRFKSYPTRDEKEHVARQCVKAYPFLEANSGTGHVSQEIDVTDTMNAYPSVYLLQSYISVAVISENSSCNAML